jgi:hypothetical protein
MFSNRNVYLNIAEEALAELERLVNQGRRPIPNGEQGYIVKYDPERKSFKQAFIAIVFSCIYLEALLFAVGAKKFWRSVWNKKYDSLKYEEKLPHLGVNDEELISESKYLRELRKDIVHEKVAELGLQELGAARFAQKEAKRAVKFVLNISEILNSTGQERT